MATPQRYLNPETKTGQINALALQIIRQSPDGIRWVDLAKAIKSARPDFHPKTVNGCIWLLEEHFPNEVVKAQKGVFAPKRV